MYWIAFGDIHESTGVLGSIPGLSEADGIIVTGDITNRGSRGAVERVIADIAAINPRIMAQPGNMDTDAVHAYLKEKEMDIHLQVRELAPGVGLMGMGFSTPTPFGTPSEVPEATLVKWLNQLKSELARFHSVIAAIHEPPINTIVDVIGAGQHVGSPGVRAFIDEVQPAVAITGHIHESRGVDMVGNTPVINPGMLAGGGFVRIDYANGRISAELMSV